MSTPSPCAFPVEAIDLLIKLRPHLSIAHHVAGRIRLKVGLGALGVLSDGVNRHAVGSLEELARLDGIETVRLNTGAQSAVITYDPVVIPDRFWRDCLRLPEAGVRALMGSTLRLGGVSFVAPHGPS